MELSSDNLFSFVLRRYRHKVNKDSREQSPRMNISIRQYSPKKDDNFYKNNDLIKYFHALIINNSNISNLLYNSVDPFINDCFNNLEFLSITNNYIRNLDFILKLPNLFFLDLFGNPLEELSALNNKNIFGYLRLSVEIFNEKKILNIFDLKCGIFDLDLKDKNTMRIFSMNNHHIGMINNEINYMIDKIKFEEIKFKTLKKKKSRRSDVSLLSFQSNSNIDLSNSDIKKDSSKRGGGISHLIKNLSNTSQDGKNSYIAEKPIEIMETKNPFLIKFKKFFTDYQNDINKTISSENSKERINARNAILHKNENFASKNLINNPKYLQHEKEKLILLFEIYKKISIFNRQKNDNEYYIGNIYSINVNKHIDNIFVKEIKDNIMNNRQIPRTSIIILIAIIFYTIGSISAKMMNALINYILKTYYNYDENQKFPDFSNLGDIHYLTFYYSTYNYIYKRMIDNEKNISIDKYKDILNILQMDKLILKSNYLYKKIKSNKIKDNKVELSEYKKFKINNEIKSIKELNITKEFLVLIEFLCDYIIYEKIEDIIINNSSAGEYSYLIELKETLEEAEFQVNKNNLLSSSLSALKFQKNKKERIFNKFYFEKDNIKQIKNKDFKNYVFNEFNKSRTLNNFSSAFGNSAFLNNSYSNFNNINNNNNEDNEYNKVDDIDVDEFFYIDNKGKNNNNPNIKNNFFRKKINNNISLYKSKERENDNYIENSFEDENSKSSIKLPNLYQNQIQKPYEEFEFLKRMIFDPDFLSQHARNVLKFEKRKKRLQKRYNLSIKNNKNFQKIDGSRNQLEKTKLKDNNGGSLCFTNCENNSSSKINKNSNISKINIDSVTNENNSNFKNYNMNFNQTNSIFTKNKYTSPINFQSPNSINLKTFIVKGNEKSQIDQKNKTTLDLDKKCNLLKHQYRGPFSEIPESFPGITLLNFGIRKNKTHLKRIKLFNKKNPAQDENNKKSYKQQVMSKIRQTIKDNFLRTARRVAYPMNQNY